MKSVSDLEDGEVSNQYVFRPVCTLWGRYFPTGIASIIPREHVSLKKKKHTSGILLDWEMTQEFHLHTSDAPSWARLATIEELVGFASDQKGSSALKSFQVATMQENDFLYRVFNSDRRITIEKYHGRDDLEKNSYWRFLMILTVSNLREVPLTFI